MADFGTSVSAIAGIAAGAGIIILFGIFFVPIMNPDPEKTWISYEPTQCSTPPWIDNWNQLHPEQNFRMIAQDEQYQVIKEYYQEIRIPVHDVKYRISSSPNCAACGCSAGFIVDFEVNETDVNKLRENILKATVQIR